MNVNCHQLIIFLRWEREKRERKKKKQRHKQRKNFKKLLFILDFQISNLLKMQARYSASEQESFH